MAAAACAYIKAHDAWRDAKLCKIDKATLNRLNQERMNARSNLRRHCDAYQSAGGTLRRIDVLEVL